MEHNIITHINNGIPKAKRSRESQDSSSAILRLFSQYKENNMPINVYLYGIQNNIAMKWWATFILSVFNIFFVPVILKKNETSLSVNQLQIMLILLCNKDHNLFWDFLKQLLKISLIQL